MRADFFGCRDCGTWGPKSCLVPHSVNPEITACPNCGSGIHTSPLPSTEVNRTPKEKAIK